MILFNALKMCAKLNSNAMIGWLLICLTNFVTNRTEIQTKPKTLAFSTELRFISLVFIKTFNLERLGFQAQGFQAQP